MKKSNKGFTLIELMIVVAIIAIIAAIAIPNLLRSRIQSNESSAVGNLRTILGAQVTYHSANYRYADSFAELTDASAGPAFLLGTWEGAVKSGYTFTCVGAAGDFAATADPESANTGSKGFFTDASGVIRFEAGGGATVASAPIGEAG